MIARLLHYAAAAALAAAGVWAAQRFGPRGLAALDEAGYVLVAPEMLWGLLVIPALLVIRAHTLSDLPRVQQGLTFLFRSAIVVALVAAMTAPHEREKEALKTSTVFVVDVSPSIPDAALERARARVEEAWLARGDHDVKLVVFADRARDVPLEPGRPDVPPLPRLPAATSPDGSEEAEGAQATDIQAAVRYALGLFEDGRLPRLVLVTDGLETQGDLAAVEPALERFAVPTHFLDLTDAPRPSELMVIGLELPPRAEANIPFPVTATLRATSAMAATCELLVDGLVDQTQPAALEAGETPVAFELRLREGGDRKIAVTCRADDPTADRVASNNRYELPLRVPEKPRILYVEGEKRFRRNLVTALEGDFDVELRGPRGIPASLGDAKAFDLVFISDVPRTGDFGYELFSTAQMKVLESYVRAGGGLILAGGENSYGPGGYTGTWLERKVLPVRLDVQKKQDMPGLALVLVIDRSGSMSGPKLELAKEAAKATMEALDPTDKLGVIAFDSAPSTVVRLQRASNRLKITDSLSRLTPGGGTAIFPALDRAYQMLATTPAKVKHIILLTDGQSSRTGVLELVTQSYQERITISTVAVDISSDQNLLMQIAEEGGGRYYFTDRPDNIPKLFLKETSEITRRALVEDRFQPRLNPRFATLQMFRGVGLDAAPPLLGYVSTRPKPKAEVLMTSHLGEPILVRWRLGMGRVLAWTSDVKNKWAHYWLQWPGYAKFWRQVIRDSLRVAPEEPTFELVADVGAGRLVVGVDAVDDADRFIEGLESEVTVERPDGQQEEVTLRQTAAGRYEADVAIRQYGPYTIRGRHHPAEDPDDTHASYATVAWPFPAEQLGGAPDLRSVRALATATGGVEGPTNEVLFDPGQAMTEKRTPRWGAPLYLAMALLLLDVLLRRLRLYGRTRIGWREVRGRQT